MKKLIFLISLLFVSIISFSQFEAGEYVDADSFKLATENLSLKHLILIPSDSGKIAVHVKDSVIWKNLDSIDNGRIKGTGTIGYIPKFTGAKTIGNSLFYDNGSYIGIGTINPIRTISILNAPGEVGQILLGQSLNYYWTLGRENVVNGNFEIISKDTRVDAGEHVRMSIDPINGRIGVGIASPDKMLHVAADGYNFRLSNSENSYGYNVGRNASDGFLYFYGDQPEYNGYVFTGIDREFFRVLNNGNLGINNVSPSEKLDVTGNLKADTIKAVLPDWDNSLAKTIDADDTTRWAASSGVSETQLVDSINNVRENAISYVEINVEGERLSLSRAKIISGSPIEDNIQRATSEHDGLMTKEQWVRDSISATKINISTTGYILKNENDTIKNSVIFEDATGNIGIGTESPSSLFHVFQGNITQETRANPLYVYQRKEPTGEGAIIINRSIGTINWEGWDSDSYYRCARIQSVATENFSTTAGGSAISFFTTPNTTQTLAEKMRLDNNGNLGLATTTPLSKFAVIGSIATNLNMFNYVNSDLNKIRTTIAEATDTSSFYLKYSPLGSPTLELKGKTGNSLFKVDSVNFNIGTSTSIITSKTGRIGINNNNPQYLLDVSGNINNSGDYYHEGHKVFTYPFESTSAGTSGQLLKATSTTTMPVWTDIKTINSNSIIGSGDIAVQSTLVSGTNIKTVNSTTLLGSGDLAVQPTLVSGTNLKSINGNSLLGSGDLTITGSQWTTDTYGITYGSNVGIGTASDANNALRINGAISNNSSSRGAIDVEWSNGESTIVAYNSSAGSTASGVWISANGGAGIDATSTSNFGGIFGGLGCKATKFYVSSLNTAPSSSSDTGTAGEIRFTADYIYVCVAANTWKRTAIATW